MDKLNGKDKVDYVNTGSTFAFYGINYESAGVKDLNLALCPQSLEADFKMLKHFESRFILLTFTADFDKLYMESKSKVMKAYEHNEYKGSSPLP